ncbi:MAG: hypothetical protein LBP55_09865 [Candidatus Adiutrix sp.]|jgi:hypothetical protein|nr:hypothetical protein [Candidatus Adiutrix sp.]
MTGENYQSTREAVDAGRTAARARDRLLLYVRGMDVPPLLSLELALEGLRRASAGAEPLTITGAMRELHSLLREKGLHTSWVEKYGPPPSSMPPFNRSSMVAEGLELSLTRRLGHWLAKLLTRRARP